MKPALQQWIEWLAKLVETPAPDPAEVRRRIEIVELNIILPIKVAAIAMVVYSFSRTPWFGVVSSTLDVAVESVHYSFGIYVLLNLVFAGVLLARRRIPLAVLHWSVFTISLVDSGFLAGLIVVSGGYDSILFWLFVGLVVRNAGSTPPDFSQVMLNLSTVLCYVMGGGLDVVVSRNVQEMFDEGTGRALDFGSSDNPTETFFIRMVVLVLTAACCYGVQVLLEKQRLAMEEAREFSLREGQLQSAGRLAGQIAHQIKNPLAIINNAIFSLRRAVKDGKGVPEEQLRIIQEEVTRSDAILTELMGYARLSEGRVERLNLTEELDRAIREVFPPAANYPTQIERDYFGYFPPLMMLRQHLSEVLVNLLQNARDATDGRGQVSVSAKLDENSVVRITIGDDGPGIRPDRLTRVFEAYYTSKSKGTGLGLAIVKHNVEMYGGSVRAESELGKGARFIVMFPARSTINPSPRT
jgi:signal transduction histidine kinase